MPSTIFSGSKVKTLKDTLNLNGGADVISSTTDPTSSAVNAAAGSLLLNTTSGKLYRKNDSGSTTNWTEVGAGGTGKNYITLGTFDNAATTGWSLASSTLDATSKLPNQASGSWGAAAGTLAISTVGAGSQLAGNYSLSLASSAASTAGNMLVSNALTLDLEAQASIQTFSFFYKIASGATNVNLSGTSSNSIAVAIYDVTNGAWIDPAGRYNVVQSSGVGKASGTFQVPANCTSVRLAVYFPNASSGAFQILLDDFVLGPQVVQYGAPVTDWQSYTPVWSSNGGTQPNLINGTILGRYRRVGDSIEAQVYLSMGSTTTFGNGTSFRFSFPTQHPLDLTKVTGSSFQSIGGGAGYDSSTNLTYVFDAQVGSGTTTSFVLIADSSNNVAFNTPFTWANADLITASVVYPAAGLSSSVQMSNDTDTRVNAVYATAGANQALSVSGTYYQIQINTIVSDTNAAFSTGSYQYVIPVSGFWQFTAGVEFAVNASGIRYVQIRKNGSAIKAVSNPSISGDNCAVQLSAIAVQCNAGDIIQVWAAQTSGGSLNALGNFSTFLMGSRLSGPSTIAASETVRAYYTAPGGQSIANNDTTQTVNFSTKVYDSHNAVTTGAAWKFTAPISGAYHVSASTLADPTAGWDATEVWTNRLYDSAGNILVGLGALNAQTTYSGIVNGRGSATIYLNAGDWIQLRVFQNNGAAVAIRADTPNNFIAIFRVGN